MNDIEIMQELKLKISQQEDYIKRLEIRCVNQLKIINKNNEEYKQLKAKLNIKPTQDEFLKMTYYDMNGRQRHIVGLFNHYMYNFLSPSQLKMGRQQYDRLSDTLISLEESFGKSNE